MSQPLTDSEREELYEVELRYHENILARGGFMTRITGTRENRRAVNDLRRDLRAWVEKRQADRGAKGKDAGRG